MPPQHESGRENPGEQGPSDTPSIGAVCWIIAATFGVLLVLIQAGVMVSLLANQVGFRWIAPIAAVGALAVGQLLGRREGLSGKQRGWLLAVSLGLMGAAAGLAEFYYDFSWDGEWYHQTAILSLAGGWDPVTEPMRPFLAPLQEWVRHYPKGPWYAAAAIFRATGMIELGKTVDGLAFAAMGCAVLGAALEAGIRRGRAWALAVVIAVNPVVLSELTTYLVDEIMVAFLVVAAAATWMCLAGRARPAVVVAGIAAAVACINAKFTGLVFLCFVAAAGALWCLGWRRDKFRRFVLVAALTLVAGTCVWGYNPYVTNVIHRGNPFYPIFGTDRYPGRDPEEANEKGETPKNLVAMGRVERFGYSIFGRPGNQPYREGRDASLMWPFGAQSKDLYAYTYHETRVAGFGPFFSAAFTLSVALGVWLLATDRRRGTLALTAGAIIGSLLISKALWWPRYGPQLWRLSEAGVKFHDVGDKRGADWKELMSVVEGYPLANRYHPAADRP